MRIIHCADIHLDSKLEANLDKEKAKQRRNEILDSFRKMVEYAHNHQVDVVMIAGDLFDTKQVRVTAKNIVKGCIKDYPEIDFLYLKGNHDVGAIFSEDESLPENLKLFDTDWKSYRYGSVTISGVELNQENQSQIYHSLSLNQDEFNIVMLHGQESDYSSEKQGDIIHKKGLQGKHIDYLALGHIHSYKMAQLDDRGVYCYSGCLEGRGFDECGEKGFVRLDIIDGKMVSEFIKWGKRSLYSVSVDITGLLETYEIEMAIRRQLQGLADGSLVKVILTGTVAEECEKNLSYLRQQLERNYFFLKIVDESRLELDFKKYQKDISLKGEFIRLVLSEAPSEQEKIILYGLKALRGEELES